MGFRSGVSRTTTIRHDAAPRGQRAGSTPPRRRRAAAAAWLAPSLGAALALAGRSASAQQTAPTATDMAVRADLLRQAEARQDAGEHAAALDLATRAGRIHMTPSVRSFLAQEQSTLGLLAEALGSAELCIRDAEREIADRQREDILAACRELRAALQPRVGRVDVVLPAPPPAGTHLSIAGHEIHEALWGVPYIVTPGEVPVEVAAPGRSPFRVRVHVGQGETARVEAWSRGDGSAGGPSGALTPGGERGGAGPADRGGGLPVGPIAVMGAGAGILGASLVFFLLRNDAIASLEARCVGPERTSCPPSAMGDYNAAATWNTATTVSLITGGVAVAGGLVWLLVGGVGRRSAAAPAPRAAASLTLVPTPHGLSLLVGGAL